jgi:uncharacterized SAM-binding protein YcdF (DUF218 family)
VFNKKYVFETKYTRSKRRYRNAFFLFLLFCTSYLLLSIYIPIYAKKQNEASAQAFYQKSPDVIAVYTGDSGRLAYTFEKADKYPSSKIFISGVYSKNNLRILLNNQGANLSVDEFLEQESHHIELEYLARNTVENGIATLNYLRSLENEGLKNILVISSDYHILRIALILKTLNTDKKYNFHFESISHDYSEIRNLKVLFKEVYKLLRTSTFLFFWDNN